MNESMRGVPPEEPKSEPEQEQTPNWKEVLKASGGVNYAYVLPKDPEKIGRMVSQAVLSKLIDTVGLGNKTQEVISEAERQGQLAASANLDQQAPFAVNYDYWQGIHPVKSSVTLERQRSEDDFFIMKTPLERIGKTDGTIEGFPDVLARSCLEAKLTRFDLGGEKPAPDVEKAKAAYERLLDRLEASGQDRTQVEERIANSVLTEHFSDLIGYERVDEILTAQGKPTTRYEDFDEFWPQKDELMRLVYDNLTPPEKQKVESFQRPFRGLMASFGELVEKGSQQAYLALNVQISEAEFRFNPDTRNMDMDLKSANYIGLSSELRPKFNLETTHQDLLELRQQALEKYQQAGLTEGKAEL